MFFFSKISHCYLELGPRTLKLKVIQDIVILHICVKLNHNQSLNEGAMPMTIFFPPKNGHCGLDLGP